MTPEDKPLNLEWMHQTKKPDESLANRAPLTVEQRAEKVYENLYAGADADSDDREQGIRLIAAEIKEAVDEAIGCLVTEGACQARIRAAVEEAQLSNNNFAFEVNRRARAEAYEEGQRAGLEYAARMCESYSSNVELLHEAFKVLGAKIRARAKEIK